jgi:glycosyltransferase involved in cell wall biosynthesis
MSTNGAPIDVYLVSAVSPQPDAPSGVTSYIISLLSHLEGTEFRGTVLGLEGSHGGGAAPGAAGAWRSVASSAGWAGTRYWRGLSRYAKRHAAQLADAIVHTQRPDYLWHFHRHVRPKPATVCTLHGTHVRTVRATWGRAAGWLYERIQRAALREVDAVIAVSRDTERFFLDLYPWLEGRTRTIPVGVDTRVFRPQDRTEARQHLGLPEDTRIVLFVGRFHVDKRLPLLLEATARVTAGRESVGLWLVGEGPEETVLRRTAGELGIAGGCHFVGKADRPTVARYMNAADLLVLPSIWEGMPTVVVEALACGLACVTTRVGDVADAVIDGQTGYVVDAQPDALADGIEKVLARHPEHWREACARRGRQFDWSVIGRRTADVYGAALAARRGQG